jgi:pathogenesis-related protein 1
MFFSTLITLAVVAVSAVSAAPSPLAARATDQEVYLSAHNSFRAKHGASALTWNQDLANYAKTLASKCKFAHSGGPYGENLAAGTNETPQQAVDSWTSEISMCFSGC